MSVDHRKSGELRPAARSGGARTKRAAGGTLDAWMTAWLADLQHSVQPTTYESYRSAWLTHAKRLIGEKRFLEFGPKDVSAFYRGLRESGVRPPTIAKLRVVMHRAFRVARNTGDYADENPFWLVAAPRYTAKEPKSLTLDQARRLVAAATESGDRYEAVAVLALACGLRLGEILGLKWSDINFRGEELCVYRSLQEVQGRFSYSEGASKAAKRRLALGTIAIAALRRRKKIAESDDLVFTTSRGTPVSRSSYRGRHFRPLLQAARLPAIRVHDLRHTFASLLLQNGVANVTGDLRKRATKKIDNALTGKTVAAARKRR